MSKSWRFMMMTALTAAGIAAGATLLIAQQRGNSGLPPGPGNPIAAAASGGAGVQGAEPNLFVVRGTVGGNGSPLQGFGYSVTTTTNLPCGSNFYPEYHVTFNQPFSSPPSVVVSAHEFLGSSLSGQPVYAIKIDDQSGGITSNGFSAYIYTDGFSTPCFGSMNWDFIAIGPR